MVKFAYRAVDSKGKPVNGTMVATDASDLQAKLEREGLWLVEAKEARKTSSDKKTKMNKARRQQLILFAIHMNSLLDAGVQRG